MRWLLLTISFATSSVTAGEYLGEMTWPDAEEALPARVVVIPFGAGAKQHGHHLPMNTDQLVMEHLVNQAVESRDIIAAPPVLHGWFPAFRSYPGTEISDPTVFQNYLEAVAASLVKHGARRLVFLNTGITRATGLPISIVARDLKASGVQTLVISWDDLETSESDAYYDQKRGGHADEGETSIMLHLKPSLVRHDLLTREYREDRGRQIGYAPGVFDRQSEPGHYGDATLATPEKGKAILAIMTKNWLAALDQFEANTR